MQPVYILSARRTPIGSFLGSLSSVSAPRLGAAAIAAAIKDANVRPDQVEQVYMGCVLPAGVGQAPARQSALFAELPKSVPCTTVNKVCGSGMKATMLGSQSIETQEAQVVVVGGMENMSQAPFYVEGARQGFRMGHQKMVDGMIKDGLWDVYNNFHMGNAAELCAKEYKFSREAQDAYAIESFKRAQEAVKNGSFKNEIVPISIPQKKGDAVTVDTDEGPSKAQFEKMPKLNPVFDKAGTITAANASTINDGAAALVLASEDFVKKSGVKPLAKIMGYAQHAQNPEWFTTAPVEASRKVLKKAGWDTNSVDLFEVNEAFAVVAMAAVKDLNVSEEKVNVNGGAISLGHPIGCSGARIIVTLLHALNARGKKRGLATLCIGGGEATALLVERL
ncbi:MAG: acetyl-CoA C-acyltransferase [Bacteriovoracia bacterium]